MLKPIRLGSFLLLSTALTATAASAQGAPPAADAPEAGTSGPDASTQSTEEEEEVEVSAPGAQPDATGDIVVTGRNIPNVLRNAPEVVSVLSSEDIARTGDGDIAGALQRVTGLSVVGNGFVFVRGLGDRYSLALLNGSPLPSPEPLRRVVPLDIFPTGLIASSVVQKSYSVNYPGEFGGGVINLTTTSIPDETFLTAGGSAELDGETTGHFGYSYYGSGLDPLGFDDGARDLPAGLRAAVAGGAFNGETTAGQRRDFAAALVNAPTTLLQRINNVAPNLGGNVSAGTAFDLLGARIGILGAVGYSNSWRTRDSLQQISLDPELAGTPQASFRRVTTDNRILVNAMLGLGAEIGEHKLRWTNLFIRDTLKQGRLAAGFNRSVQDQDPNLPASIIEQNSYWFERQLIDTQFVGEFKFGALSVDLRGAYANTQRISPYERDISYTYLGDGNPATKGQSDVDDYVNNLTSGGQSATIAFNDLSEDVYAGGIDFAYRLNGAAPTTLSAGYAYTKSRRDSSRFQFQYFRPEGALPISVAQERPDYLLSDFNIYNFNIQLRDISGAEGAAAYEAGLRIRAGYAQAEIELPGPALRAQFGVRYEDAVETVVTGAAGAAATRIANAYWLPAATITWTLADNMQLRLHGSKTIARPQFRELAPQIYQDFESDREFTGNPFLTDSRLTNAEARFEYYFRRGERFSLAGFYKKIDNPIESAAFFAGGGQLRTGFANAPQATLYGVEAELQTYLPLSGLGQGFANKRLLLIGNYTYARSKVKSDDTLVIGPDLQPVEANLLFEDGAPLTGQSDHLANIQLGVENRNRLQQATFLLTYASERVTERGPIQGSARQPDIVEKPGLRLDFVAREGIRFLGSEAEIKLEARNLLGQDYEEYQQSGDNRIDINSYKVGRTVSVGMSLKF
ncbi:MAG TPA: TonB-dependent receptor [Allosphingosinicella sp.]|jgi:outer membrane receptor protein involved in Fe transport